MVHFRITDFVCQISLGATYTIHRQKSKRTTPCTLGKIGWISFFTTRVDAESTFVSLIRGVAVEDTKSSLHFDSLVRNMVDAVEPTRSIYAWCRRCHRSNA